MRNTILLIVELVAIVFGILAIIEIVKDPEMIVSLISLSFGILAIIWTFIAMTSLSKGSSLRNYVALFLIALIFMLMFSIWHALSNIFKWEKFLLYPEYILISLAYLTFVATAYRVYKLSKEFGFKEKSNEMKAVLKKK